MWVRTRTWWNRCSNRQKASMKRQGYPENALSEFAVADYFGFMTGFSVHVVVTLILMTPVLFAGYEKVGGVPKYLFLQGTLSVFGYTLYDFIALAFRCFFPRWAEQMGFRPIPLGFFLFMGVCHHLLTCAVIIPLNMMVGTQTAYHQLFAAILFAAAVCYLTGLRKMTRDASTEEGLKAIKFICVVQLAVNVSLRGVLWIIAGVKGFQDLFQDGKAESPVIMLVFIYAGLTLFNAVIIWDTLKTSIKWLPRNMPMPIMSCFSSSASLGGTKLETIVEVDEEYEEEEGERKEEKKEEPQGEGDGIEGGESETVTPSFSMRGGASGGIGQMLSEMRGGNSLSSSSAGSLVNQYGREKGQTGFPSGEEETQAQRGVGGVHHDAAAGGAENGRGGEEGEWVDLEVGTGPGYRRELERAGGSPHASHHTDSDGEENDGNPELRPVSSASSLPSPVVETGTDGLTVTEGGCIIGRVRSGPALAVSRSASESGEEEEEEGRERSCASSKRSYDEVERERESEERQNEGDSGASVPHETSLSSSSSWEELEAPPLAVEPECLGAPAPLLSAPQSMRERDETRARQQIGRAHEEKEDEEDGIPRPEWEEEVEELHRQRREKEGETDGAVVRENGKEKKSEARQTFGMGGEEEDDLPPV
uniref:Uncharacterized protein n=1 Tax=Chromera velia CCMP2878 TaxID=1169474 RepID=A0A0G4GLJ6_9ALVE|eukprot:Cvel_22431.t1-p1 / transcript=Cvel_22431.t1 / gene=Cvel_22431 / organism=Chromera_velia_CCMP2878 / gene_product=hypothetical protein / transcript_product=hypothetical protein / location=Cvel_scaffold2203:6564-9865(+) / protein_length=648 / sequence_SO=supercontig / SO=protein_coding / is_pseudo=false